MLLRGKHKSTKIHQLVLQSPQASSQQVYNVPPRRHSMTAKTKSRVRTPVANKTISLKPEGKSTPVIQSNLQNSADLLPNSTFSFYNNQPVLNQFDNLQLQDFLKYVIVGDNKVAEDKSQQIIRSLNGTWFKNTQSSELPSSKLYNNIGIRRNRMMSKNRESDSFHEEDVHGHHFMKEYTPPNIFPGKKIDSKKLYPSKSFIQNQGAQKLKISEESPLKLHILKRMPQGDNRSNNMNFKRSQTQFEKKKSVIFSSKNRDQNMDNGLIQGTKMQLHKD